MKQLIAAATLAVSVLGGSAHAATRAQDVMGREVPVGQGRPTLVLYANRDTRAQLHAAAVPLAYELRNERPVVVVHVDLSDVPGMFRGMAKSEVQKSQRETLAEMAQLFRQHGEQPPAGLDTSLFMVADADGQPARAMGLEKHFHQPFAQALDPQGGELMRGPLPSSGPALEKAIAAHPSQQPAPTVQAQVQAQAEPAAPGVEVEVDH